LKNKKRKSAAFEEKAKSTTWRKVEEVFALKIIILGIVPKSKDATPISYDRVDKVKTCPLGLSKRYKLLPVALGSSQQYGLGFDKPLVLWLRLLLLFFSNIGN
jgi:hypothetical protein